MKDWISQRPDKTKDKIERKYNLTEDPELGGERS